MNTEQLIQAANYHTDMNYPMGVEREYPVSDFIAGAIWQYQRMYSEEEVKLILESFRYHIEQGNDAENIDSFFAQFKKKDK